MRLNRLFIILLCLFSLSQLSTQAQNEPILIYEPLPPAGMNEEEYIASLLAGEGVVIENVTRTCDDEAFGIFRTNPINTPTPNFGIDDGIVLSTGLVADVAGPSTGIVSTGLNTPGDADLAVLAEQPTQDACIIEFDITPIGEVLSFYYVFGSEEYDNYVCDVYNDVFGFLISGPNPDGGTYNNLNIALIPGTNIPVAVSTVNDGNANSGSGSVCILDYDEYYYDVIPEIEFEGITDTLKAEIAVIPCQTYHLKIGIADAGPNDDNALDSGVFIQAGSFTSPTPDLDLTGGYETFELDENGDFVLDGAGLPIPEFMDSKGNSNGYILEGCVSKTLVFSVSNLEEDATIDLDISGTATNGVDYYYLDNGVPTAIPETITLTPDNPTVTYEIFAPLDEFEGPDSETIILQILGINSVNCVLGSTSATDTIRIFDNILAYAQASADKLGPFCPGDPVFLNVYGGEEYEWFPPQYFNDPTSDEPIAFITEDVTLGVVVTNGPCKDTLFLDEMTVYNALPAVEPEYALCNEIPIELTTSNGSNFQWSPADNLSCTSCPIPTFTPTGENETYTVSFFNSNGCLATDTVQIVYDNPTFLTLVEGTDTIIKCPEEEVKVRFTGGSSYEWTPVEGLSCSDCPDPFININKTTDYTIHSLTQQGCEDMREVRVVVNFFSADAGGDFNECTEIEATQIGSSIQEENYLYQWSPTTGLSDSTIAQPYFEWTEADGLPFYEEYTLTITDSTGCQVRDEMIIEITGNPSVEVIGNSNLTMGTDSVVIYAGQRASISASGANLYSWSPAEFLSNSTNASVTARPDTTTMFMVEGTDANNCKNSDEIKVIVNDPPRIIAPSAFSPNNDGIHDEFVVLSKDIELISLKVFNRWGVLMYENPGNVNDGWDGQFEGAQQEMGVYLYFAEYRFVGDEVSELKTITGNVTLLR